MPAILFDDLVILRFNDLKSYQSYRSFQLLNNYRHGNLTITYKYSIIVCMKTILNIVQLKRLFNNPTPDTPPVAGQA